MKRSEQIAKLNDQLRLGILTPSKNKVMLAGALAQEPPEVHFRVLAQVASYDRFNADNDPHGEHDMGFFEFEGSKMMWKISYYDNDLQYHSPDETDPEQTVRVLTVMYLADY